MNRGEFTCRACGHSFDRLGDASESSCPRCGGRDLEHNPYLFGTAGDNLSLEDYFDVVLAPCCRADWTGWRTHFYSQGGWTPPEERGTQGSPQEDEEPQETPRG